MDGEVPVDSRMGAEIPTLKNPDLQMLIQDFAQARKDLHQERRTSEKKIQEERERSAWEISRVRAEFEEKIRGISFENDGLVRSLGRIQGDNNKLREEIYALKFKLSAPIPTTEAQKEKPKTEAPSSWDIPSVMIAPPIVVNMGSGIPNLSKPVNIRKD